MCCLCITRNSPCENQFYQWAKCLVQWRAFKKTSGITFNNADYPSFACETLHVLLKRCHRKHNMSHWHEIVLALNSSYLTDISKNVKNVDQETMPEYTTLMQLAQSIQSMKDRGESPSADVLAEFKRLSVAFEKHVQQLTTPSNRYVFFSFFFVSFFCIQFFGVTSRCVSILCTRLTISPTPLCVHVLCMCVVCSFCIFHHAAT
jgi:hypothetical protein